MLGSSFFLMSETVYAESVSQQRFKRMKAQAASGDKRAQYRLGLAYMLGNEVKVDINESIHWFKQSAKQGYIKAAHKLGVLYFNNRDGKRNYAQAVQWFTVGAKRNYAPSQYFLAKMYFTGKGVTKDLDYALVWSARAGKNGMNTRRQYQQIELALKSKSKKRSTPKRSVKPKKRVAARPPRRSQRKKRQRNQNRGYSARSKRHTLEVVLSGFWMKGGKPAEHMPSGLNKCKQKGETINCVSERTSRSTNDYRADYKVDTTLFGFTRNGTFNIQFRITYIFVLPFDSDDPDPSYDMPKTGRSKTVNIRHCQILDKTNIRCFSDDKKIKELFTKIK